MDEDKYGQSLREIDRITKEFFDKEKVKFKSEQLSYNSWDYLNF